MVRKAENRIGLAVRIPNGKRLSTGTLTANVETLDVPKPVKKLATELLREVQ